MARKLVLMKGGNGKPVSLPGSLADGLVKMRRATYFESDAPAVAKKPVKGKAKPATKTKAKDTPKSMTYQTRALEAVKPAGSPPGLSRMGSVFGAAKPATPAKPKTDDED